MADVLQNFISDVDATRQLFVSFTIKGNNLIPDRITSNLDIVPTDAFAKGDIIVSHKGFRDQVPKTFRPWGIWRISTKDIVHSNNINDHFQYLLNLLHVKQEKLNKYLANSQEYSVSIRVSRKALGYAGQLDMDSFLLGQICQLCHLVTFHYIGISE